MRLSLTTKPHIHQPTLSLRMQQSIRGAPCLRVHAGLLCSQATWLTLSWLTSLSHYHRYHPQLITAEILCVSTFGIQTDSVWHYSRGSWLQPPFEKVASHFASAHVWPESHSPIFVPLEYSNEAMKKCIAELRYSWKFGTIFESLQIMESDETLKQDNNSHSPSKHHGKC